MLILCSFLNMALSELVINKLQPSFSAELLNLDVSKINEEQFLVVNEMLLEHKILVIRNQKNLTAGDLRSFTRRFGDLHVHLESASHCRTPVCETEYDDVNVVSNIRNDEGNFIGLYGAHVENFHSDLSWAQVPTKITILKSIIRPSECGNTRFLDSTAAYSALNSSIKAKLDGKRASFCYLKTRKLEVEVGLTSQEISAAQNCANHPVVTTHPVTKRKNIYANPSHTQSIIGLENSTSCEILNFLFDHTSKPVFEYVHAWKDDDLVIWDNRAVHHAATGCPESFPRLLIRTTVLNDSPPE